jgi:hypothetical protein
MRWFLKVLSRSLPFGIPLGFLTIAILLYYRQNHTTVSREGNFCIAVDDDIESRHAPNGLEHDVRPPRLEPESIDSIIPPVAKKYTLRRRAGLSFFDRGHDTSFVAEIPQLSAGGPLIDKLNRRLWREYEQCAVDFAQADWSLVCDGFRRPDASFRHWEGSINVEIAHTSREAVSLVETRYEYTGGAHGQSNLVGRCFVEERGQLRELALMDLFERDSDWEKRLVGHCLSDLRCQGASSISDVCLAESDTPRLSAEDLAQFTLSPTGLRFYFSPYHVGCYAEGSYTVHVPYAIFRDFMSPTSPARRFMDVGSR